MYLFKTEEQSAASMKEEHNKETKCKDCYWFSGVSVNVCELDGSEPCNPDGTICAWFDPSDD